MTYKNTVSKRRLILNRKRSPRAVLQRLRSIVQQLYLSVTRPKVVFSSSYISKKLEKSIIKDSQFSLSTNLRSTLNTDYIASLKQDKALRESIENELAYQLYDCLDPIIRKLVQTLLPKILPISLVENIKYLESKRPRWLPTYAHTVVSANDLFIMKTYFIIWQKIILSAES